jgi:hypothetical protein
MILQNLADQQPFTTKDGSTIRSILDRTNAPVQNQSLAEAQVPAGTAISASLPQGRRRVLLHPRRKRINENR